MYVDAKKSGSAGGFCITAHQRLENESNYHKNAEQAMSDENIYKIMLYKGEGKITFELIECSDDESSNDGDEESNQSSRTLRSSSKNLNDKDNWKDSPEKLDDEVEKSLFKNPAFLKRILQKQKTPNQVKDKHSENEMDIDSNEENSSTDNKDSESSDKPIDKKKCEFSLRQCRSLFIVQNENVLCRARFNQEKVAVVS